MSGILQKSYGYEKHLDTKSLIEDPHMLLNSVPCMNTHVLNDSVPRYRDYLCNRVCLAESFDLLGVSLLITSAFAVRNPRYSDS
jgi:hypothetical protein